MLLRLLLTTTLNRGEGREWMNVTGGKENGDTHMCIEYSLLSLGVFRMFLTLAIFP